MKNLKLAADLADWADFAYQKHDCDFDLAVDELNRIVSHVKNLNPQLFQQYQEILREAGLRSLYLASAAEDKKQQKIRTRDKQADKA